MVDELTLSGTPLTKPVREQLLSLLSDCQPVLPMRVKIEADYNRGRITRVESWFQSAEDDVAKAYIGCIEARSRVSFRDDPSVGRYAFVVQYTKHAARFPYPVPTASAKAQYLGSCTSATWDAVIQTLERRGYEVHSFEFVDGMAVATVPEQLDFDEEPLPDGKRFLRLHSSCWGRYGTWSGLARACWMDLPAERVRTFAFVCSSADDIVQLDYEKADPAIAQEQIVFSGSLQPMPFKRTLTNGRLYALVYFYTRQPGNTVFELDTRRNVSADLKAALGRE
jgi:hypothetical protein